MERRQAIPNTEARKGMMAKCLQSDMWNRQKSGSGLSELRGQKDFFFFWWKIYVHKCFSKFVSESGPQWKCGT